MHRISSWPARVTVSSIGRAAHSQRLIRGSVPRASQGCLSTQQHLLLPSHFASHRANIIAPVLYHQQVRHGWAEDLWRQLWGAKSSIAVNKEIPTSTIVVKDLSGKILWINKSDNFLH